MSNEKLVSLSGDAGDVLYSLISVELCKPVIFPLRLALTNCERLGWHTQHTATRFGGEDYFTFLTAEGQRFAIQYLAETNFGKAKDKPEMLVMQKAIGGGYTPEEISAAVEHIQGIRAAKAFSKAAKKVSPFAIKDGEVFIRDAFIGNGITTANWSMKVSTDVNGHRYAAGVGIAVNNASTRTRLSDDVREAVIDAVRESDVFKALQALQDAQISALVTTQQAIEQAATDAIRKALKPGGLLHSRGR